MKTYAAEPFEIGKAFALIRKATKLPSIIIPIKYGVVKPRLLCYEYRRASELWWKRYVSPELYSPVDTIDPVYKRDAIRAMFFGSSPFTAGGK